MTQHKYKHTTTHGHRGGSRHSKVPQPLSYIIAKGPPSTMFTLWPRCCAKVSLLCIDICITVIPITNNNWCRLYSSTFSQPCLCEHMWLWQAVMRTTCAACLSACLCLCVYMLPLRTGEIKLTLPVITLCPTRLTTVWRLRQPVCSPL